ncbi:cation-translocating P-type ATPase [Fibrella sp. ES10-3-2-2]|nr:haloacid dehalogenase [Fibrella sp. ES10-3-2-2]
MQATSQVIHRLSSRAVYRSRKQYGPNTLPSDGRSGLFSTVKEVATEPMFLLLLVACTLYFVLGQLEEAITLIVALVLVAGISVYQSVRSNQALGALHKLTQPQAQVHRNGKLTLLPTEEIVVGDAVLVAEGQQLPADGQLNVTSDFAVDEATLTGESVAVAKVVGEPVYAGTSVVAGSAWFTVTAVGQQTELGQIGHRIGEIHDEKTPLQRQISQFIWWMAWIGAGEFILVWAVNYSHSGNWMTALLFALTLAMSILPEEIPVAFSSFMALGAARLSQLGVLTKQPQTVESLGSATVICTDKTGTITQDGMVVRYVYDAMQGQLSSVADPLAATPAGHMSDSALHVLAYARWASETAPFDPMEKAIVAACQALPLSLADTHPLIHEYPLAGTPPMMTHVRQSPDGELLVAGKGAVEHIVAVCHPEAAVSDQIRLITSQLSAEGLRVLGVAAASHARPDFPAEQDDFNWSLIGLIALENPPKPNAKAVISAFTEAGIKVKLITGDFPETAQAIARQVGLPGADTFVTGQQLMGMDDSTLQYYATTQSIFARMFPEAKLRVVNALKLAGEVVAMTGDGVNDGPALKAAHIGVAMGKRGTEVARQAASLVLVNDDLTSMIDAIAQGRRIYQNLKKAVAYIVSIHIPIILTVAVPLLANWSFANLFTPVHVIFLELVMGPTCSIAFENEPAEAGQMQQPPRPLTATFLGGRELIRSLLQGLGITGAVLGMYYVSMQEGQSIEVVRTLVFATLVCSNILLALVNRSFTSSVFSTLPTPNRLLWLLLSLTLGLLLTTLFFAPVQQLFGFAPLSASSLGWCALSALIGVGWIELYKLVR